MSFKSNPQALTFRFMQWALAHETLCNESEHSISTIDCIRLIQRWDYQQALAGKFSPRDPFGKPFKSGRRAALANAEIAGGYTAAVVLIRSDLEWKFKVTPIFVFCDTGWDWCRHLTSGLGAVPWELLASSRVSSSGSVMPLYFDFDSRIQL